MRVLFRYLHKLLSSMSTVFWPFIVYWHTENSAPFPQEASSLTSLLSASSHSCLWPLPFLAFELREHYLPSGCLTCLNGKCEEIKGKSFTLFFIDGLKLKSLSFFLPTGLQDESYLHYLPSVSSLHHVKTSCPLPLFWLFRKIEMNKDTLKFSEFKYFIPFRVPPNGLCHENQTKTMINLKSIFLT